MKLTTLAAVLTLSLPALAAERVRVEVTPVEPVRFEQRGGSYFVDFGRDAYATLRIEFTAEPPAGRLTVRLGEKLAADGQTIDRKPGGSIAFVEAPLEVGPGRRSYTLDLPHRKRVPSAVPTPAEVGEVTPFRYAEIVAADGASLPSLEKSGIRQLFAHAPFDDNASSFESSDPTLNAVWDLCKHTMKATTAFGVYIDGERERTPYEADAYINQLSHYACDLDPRVARYTFEYLLKHPTWPTEWSLHVPMIAAEDYLATGDLVLAREHYAALKEKLLMGRARTSDGLLQDSAVVDWPPPERDGYNDGVADPKQKQQVGPEINTVANAFYYHALDQMAMLARALGNEPDARDLEAKASQVKESFNRVFFDPARGTYTDGEGSAHASLHANLFPLAFGLVPEDRQKRVADFVESRGMACSVYGAQYLLEGMFRAGHDRYAVGLMTSRGPRSWWHMIEQGSTMTLEAWGPKFKPNLTWNHAWGSAPANVIARFVLGVRPLEPGYAKLVIAPQPGGLKWARGKVPTPHGPVVVSWKAEPLELDVVVPPGTSARVVLPVASDRAKAVSVNGAAATASVENGTLVVGPLPAGAYAIRAGGGAPAASRPSN